MKNIMDKENAVQNSVNETSIIEQEPKKKPNWKKLLLSIIALVVIVALVLGSVAAIQAYVYSSAVEALNSGDYDTAIGKFEQLKSYRDSQDQLLESKYRKAAALSADEHYLEAVEIFESIKDYRDSGTQIKDTKRGYIFSLLESGDLSEARSYMEQHQLAEYKETGLEVQYYEALKIFGMTKGNDDIVFSDPAVETEIRKSLGKPSDDIGLRDMLNVTEFLFDTINDREAIGTINSLDDLKYCLNLEKLNITNQPLKDIEGLRGLPNLNDISIFGCGIIDLSPLSEAVNLERIWMNGNPVGNAGLDILCKLPKIKEINAWWGTNITSLESLNNCTTLEEFLCEQKFDDISPLLNNPRLKSLTLTISKDQLNILKQLKKITWLCIDNSGLSSDDLGFLSSYNLNSFSGRNNNITHLDFLSGSTDLSQLHLVGNKITDITQLLNKTHLDWVSLPSSISASDRQKLESTFPDGTFMYY